MVADDKVDAHLLRLSNLVDGLDATVEDDDQLHSCLGSMVEALLADAVALFVAVGDVILDVGVELLQEAKDQCYGSTSVDIVVTINHDALLAAHRVVQTVDGNIHVVHQERVDQLAEQWTQESLCCRLRAYATLDEQLGHHRTRVEFLC